ncbi:GDP-mannose 4,6-dehydratase, partial [Calditrichota bacterium]
CASNNNAVSWVLFKYVATTNFGLIGSYVVEELLSEGYHPVVLDNLEPQVHGDNHQWPQYLSKDAEKILGDVRDRELVARCLTNCDAVIHLAAAVGVGQSMYEIEKFCNINVIGTAILLEEVIKQKDHIEKLIVASSMSIYGEGTYLNKNKEKEYPEYRNTDDLKNGRWELYNSEGAEFVPVGTEEEKPLKPTSVYATTKRDQEENCMSVCNAYGIPAVAFRMFNVYGPRQALSNPYTGVCAIFSSRLLNKQPPLIFEDGNQRRDFIQVEDVARAYLRAIDNDSADGMILNLGSGQSVSINEIAEILIEKLNIDVIPIITSKFRNGDVRHCFADITKIKESLSWEPRYSFSNGVESLLDWLKSQSAVDRVSTAFDELEKRGLVK